MSSFALAFRRKSFLDRVLAAEGPDRTQSADAVPRPIPPVGQRIGEVADRSPARRAALLALLIAAALLAVFNSEGLVSTARDLAESRLGRSLLPVAERWDDAMERVGAKRLMASVRGLVLDAQYASWSDVAAVFGAGDDPITAKRRTDDGPYTSSMPGERR
ncbi:hypothetical protein A7A08_01516 [Methyloligella halotolerans]|uniref:Uncharacterized protein n=1 Tax=Methyloligella halotolerans TaxID=1177755 RepID=A0A1E2RZ42_9HYPH|nr:hypothetical protein [Methyloligella halotolerans]ODA67484.1 hypothetical protein A7A08_01516 [Methyloligella halotolerans]